MGHLGLTGLAFLLQFLEAGNDHGQQLHNNRGRNVRHDADGEDRQLQQRATREEVNDGVKVSGLLGQLAQAASN